MTYEAVTDNFFQTLMAEWGLDAVGVSEVYKALRQAPFINPESVRFTTTVEPPIALMAEYTGHEKIGNAGTDHPRRKNPAIVKTAENIFAHLSERSGIGFRNVSPDTEKNYCFGYASVHTDKKRNVGLLVIINQNMYL
ncbi:MAG: hypothetical protein HY514_04225 [Candidatus Aenigmarchaeota archaeon]|nr:hypothetical protein [Candidatus Aenigmarchaeota archaeon]